MVFSVKSLFILYGLQSGIFYIVILVNILVNVCKVGFQAANGVAGALHVDLVISVEHRSR